MTRAITHQRFKAETQRTHDMSFEEISEIIDNYMQYYNYERRQARLGNLPPVDYALKLAA